jgi:CubicO group peptidase (beta-lactamase class C family)
MYSAATPPDARRAQVEGTTGQLDTDRRIALALATLVDPVLVRGTPIHYESIGDRMRAHVPGVSIAVADAGRIVWTGAFGVRNANTAEPVTPHTVFQAASVSKSIAATGALRLVQAKLVDLDADVNRYLSSWRVPETEFTRREKVTLRRLMSHRAGVTGRGFISYGTADFDSDAGRHPSCQQ